MADINQAMGASGSTWMPDASKRQPKQEYDKDLFIKLLVAQMQYQDPLQPQDNGQFISQMATFSQLEQLQAMSASVNATNYFAMIGKGVFYADGTRMNGEEVETIMKSGVVDAVEYDGNGGYALSINGQLVKMEAVLAVVDANAVQGGSVMDASHLVGKQVTGSYVQNKKDAEGNDVKDDKGVVQTETIKVDGRVTKVSTKDGGVYVTIVDANGKEHDVHVNNISEIRE